MADSNVGRSDEPVRESPADVSAQIAGAPARSAAYGSSRFSVSLHASQQVLDLTPGYAAVVEVLIANHGPFPDTLTLEVDGPPVEWVTLAQQVVPIDVGMQLAIPLVVAVPEGSMARAGVYLVTLRAFSGVRPGEYSEARTCWIVRAVAAAQLSVTPQQQSDRREALFTLSITNLGNAPASYILSAEDDQQALDISLDQPTVLVEPARTLHTPLSVSAGAPRLVKTSHTLRVRAEAPGMEEQTVRARFVQEPLVPLWLPAAGLLALVMLLCLLGRLPVALAGDLPFFGALVALPATATPEGAASGGLATAQADAQRTSVAIESTLAAIETRAATSEIDQHGLETAVAELAATQQGMQTALAEVPTTAQNAAQTAVAETRLTPLPATGPGSNQGTPSNTARPVPQSSPAPSAPTASLQPTAGTSVPTQQPTNGTAVPTSQPIVASPSITLTPSQTATPSQTSTPSQTATPSITLTPSPTPTPTPLPELSINDVSGKEGDSSGGSITFSVSLSQASQRTVTINYATTNGSAQASLDYVGTSGSLTFDPGETLKRMSISLIGNTRVDGDRTFNVVLSNPVQAILVKSTGVGTIADDDQSIAFGPLPNRKVGDPPFTVSATASSGLPVSFAAAGSCSVAGDTVTITGAGTCTITASQAGNALFNQAPPVSQIFTIAP